MRAWNHWNIATLLRALTRDCVSLIVSVSLEIIPFFFFLFFSFSLFSSSFPLFFRLHWNARFDFVLKISLSSCRFCLFGPRSFVTLHRSNKKKKKKRFVQWLTTKRDSKLCKIFCLILYLATCYKLSTLSRSLVPNNMVDAPGGYNLWSRWMYYLTLRNLTRCELIGLIIS